MSLHHRTLIRRHVAQILSTPKLVNGQNVYPTPAGDRVYPCRVLGLSVYPAIMIYDDLESVANPESDIPRRQLNVSIECVARGSSEMVVDEGLDLLALAVELVLGRDATLGGLTGGAYYAGMNKAREKAAEDFLGRLAMKYQVAYSVAPEIPGQDMADFLLFHGEHRIGGTIGAVDEVQLPPTQK